MISFSNYISTAFHPLNRYASHIQLFRIRHCKRCVLFYCFQYATKRQFKINKLHTLKNHIFSVTMKLRASTYAWIHNLRNKTDDISAPYFKMYFIDFMSASACRETKDMWPECFNSLYLCTSPSCWINQLVFWVI